MLAFSALVAASFSFGAMIAGRVDPAALMFVRFVIAAVAIGAVAAATGQLRRRWFTPLTFNLCYVGLALCFAIYFVLMFEALALADPVSIAAVFTLTPALSAVIGRAWLRQPVPAATALALGIGALGAVWVVFRADLSALARFHVGPGERLMFLGSIAHATYPVAARRWTPGVPPLAVLTAMMIAAAVLLGLWAWPDIAATPWTALGWQVWGVIAYLALVSGALTFFLVQYSSLRLPGAKVLAYTYLTPGWVALWEIALGHDAPPLLTLAGVALTAVALLILLRE